MPVPFRTLRVRKHADYGLVYGASRKHQSASLSFFYRPRSVSVPGSSGSSDLSARFGITVPRVLGPAVMRNRIKRRIRVAARAALHLLPPATDVVLHPRPVAATMPFPALQSELEAVFATVARRIASSAVNTPLPRTPRRGKDSVRPVASGPRAARP